MLDVGVGPSVLVERGNKGYTGVSVHLGVCACSAYVVKCVNNTLGFMYHIEIALMLRISTNANRHTDQRATPRA